MGDVSMKWTDEPPTKPGWHWHETYKGMLRGVPVYEHKCSYVYFRTITYKDGTTKTYITADGIDINQLSGRWAGPIPEPTEE